MNHPMSPGGTEIKPPPLPKHSPKRATRSTPSPTRTKQASLSGSAVADSPESDISKLASVLENAFRSGKSTDSRVEDVKAIAELPQLEIKDHERELTPAIAGDWLALIGPSLKDLSAHASVWWKEVLDAAQHYYGQVASFYPNR